MNRKAIFALVASLTSFSYAVSYEPIRSSDPFKGTSSSYVVYNITDQRVIDYYNSVKSTICGANSVRRVMAGTQVNSDKSKDSSFGFVFQQAIPDDVKNLEFDSVPQDGELILLIDGKPSEPAKVISSEVTKERLSCSTNFGKVNFTFYSNIVFFDGQFSQSAFGSAEEVKYRVYTKGSGYTGIIPKDIRANLLRMLNEK